MPDEPATPMLERLKRIRARARNYFKRAGTALSAREYSYPEYWSDLPPRLKTLGADISNELAEVGGELAQAMKRSPLGTEEGQRSAVLNIKGMATALRLRKFEYWNAQVMSQEDTYDVIRAGESDETPLDPTAAQMTFDGFAERLQAHIDLVIHSIPSDQAPAPAAQQTTVDPKTLRKVWVKKKWPAKLKEARIALGQSQKQAAPLCHVSLETYKKWEQGRRPPSDSNARNVLAYIAESLKGSS